MSEVWFRIRALFLRPSMDRELLEEMEDHVRRETRKLEQEGMSREEAHRLARVRFGGVDRHREQAGESWGVTPLLDLGGDVRFAARQLLKNPAFTALAVLTLALGIGGTVALTSVVYGIMLRPLPVADEAEVVTWWQPYNWRGAEFDHVRGVTRAYSGLAAYSNDAYTLRTDVGGVMILATVASAELFDVLDVRPLLGRAFQAGDDRPGAEPVIVLGHALWSQHFGSDPAILGRRLDVGGTVRTVVGVMPEEFYFPTPDSDAFVPLDLDPATPGYAGNGWLIILGRTLPGLTEAQLNDDLQRIAVALDEEYDYPAAWDKTRNPGVVPLREYLFGEVRPALLLLLGAVGMVLLMACVNVTALLLTRTVDRTREMAVRATMGAGRARLARQLLTESLLLGLVAGLVGVGLAVALFDVLVASLPLDAAFRETLHLDRIALGVALILSIVAGSLISLAPMRGLLSGDLSGVSLTDRSAGAGTANTGRMQSALVVAEVLLAVVLVTGASLLVRTVDQLRSVELGFEPDRLLAIDVLVPGASGSPEERAAFHDALLARVGALPGVEEVALTNRLPLRDGGWQGTVGIEGRTDLEGPNRPNALYRPVTPGAFAALGAEIVAGRGLLASDSPDAPIVAVVNQTFARRIWGDESPIGRTYTTGFLPGVVEIVGVVKDLAVTSLTGEPPMSAYYAWDQAQRGADYAVVLVRTSGDPDLVAPVLRTLVTEIEPSAVSDRLTTMEEALDAEMAEALRLRFFLGLFSLLGIVLGSVGIYGVVSYSVERRRSEFGIRLALGANPRTLLGGVLRAGLLPVAAGIVGGTVVALFASSLLARFLFEVRPVDPVSIVASAAILLAIGAAAAFVPAVRASGTEPAVALRAD